MCTMQQGNELEIKIRPRTNEAPNLPTDESKTRLASLHKEEAKQVERSHPSHT